MWGNLYRLSLLAVTIALAWSHASFWAVAAGQVFTIVFILLVIILALRWSKPDVCPRLDYWDGALAWRMLKPSAFFGLFVLNNFLVYQAPVLMLQRFLGAEVVVAFSVARTLFSFVRQGSAVVQQGIAPEITRLNGIGDKEKLVRLYVIFEGALLATVLIVNVGVFTAGPVLLRFWLKRPELFNLNLFVPVMLISIVSSIKEYKIYFQYATNRHAMTGLTTFTSYLVMLIVSFAGIQWFGVTGFLTTWLAVELLQLGLVHSYNAQLFKDHEEISLVPALRLGITIAAMLTLAFSARSFLQSQHYLLQGIAAVSAMLILAGVSYFLFNLRDVVHEGKGQLLRL
jgi:O-antigen/teichoic acid export membrane protein